MTISVDGDGHLVELHKNLEVSGVRYLIEPVRGVSIVGILFAPT